MKVIREIAAEDEASLTRFFLENDRPEVTRFFHAFPLNAESAQRICRLPRKDRYFAMFEGDEIITIGFLRGWDEGYEIPTFGIFAGHQYGSRAFAFRLFRWVIDFAREIGCKKIRVTIHPDNPAPRRGCEFMGFERKEDLPNGHFVMMKEL